MRLTHSRISLFSPSVLTLAGFFFQRSGTAKAMAGTGKKAAPVGSSGGTDVVEPAKKPSSIKRLGMALKKKLSLGNPSSQTAEEVPEAQPALTKEAPSVVTRPPEKQKETEKVVEEPRKEEDHPKKRGRSQVPLFSAIGVAAGIVFIAFKVATK